MQRARSDADRDRRRPAYKEARAALKREIGRRKFECFRRLCDDADENPWGDAYHIVLRKFSVTPRERCPIMLKWIVEGLFPQHEPVVWPSTPQAVGMPVPRFSVEELTIPNVALKVAIQK